MVARTSTLWRRKGSSEFSSWKNQAAFFRPPPVSRRRPSSRESSMRMPKLFLDLRKAATFSAVDSDFEEGAAAQFNEGFGDVVGERAEAGAETGGENHGFHRRTPKESL